MVKLKLPQQRPTHVSAVMIALAAILLVDTIYQTGMHLVWRQWLPATLAAPTATTQPATTQPADTQQAATKSTDGVSKKKNKAKPKPIPELITRRDIFNKPKPKGHGFKLTGVAFNTAMFVTRSGQTVGIEEGKSSQGIKVVAIKDYEVTIEYKGKTETMKLFTESSAGCWSAGDAHAERPSMRSPEAIDPRGAPPSSDRHESASPEDIKRAAKRERSGRRAITIQVGPSPQTQEAR